MIAPPLPADEAQRLALLRALDLLDAEPEPALDAVTRLAARLLDVPIALVSLVEEQRQWFLSRHGVEETETPRPVSFCGHAILGEGLFLVPDAQADERFADNPLVVGAPFVRAYAGMPLRSIEGHALGTLCAIDHRPRRFSDAQLQVLHDLSLIVRREIHQREAAWRARSLADEHLKLVADRAALYDASFERAAIGIALVGLDGQWLRVNPMMSTILGRSREALSSMRFDDVTHPEDLALDRARMRQLLDGDADHFQMEKRYLRPDGRVVWGHLTVTLVREHGQPHHFISVLKDITARREAEASLQALRAQLEQRVLERTAQLQRSHDQLLDAMRQRQVSEEALAISEAELRAVLENAQDAYLGIDEAGRITEWNRQAEQMFGWPRAEAMGRPLDELLVPLAQRQAHHRGLQALRHGDPDPLLGQRLELPVQRRDGSVIPCEVTVTALPSRSGGRMYAAFLHDISQRKEAERRLESLAVTDTLTGLPNRRGLEAALAAALGRARRQGRRLALLFIDIDHFKAINDRHGHAVGDEVLRACAQRMRDAVRETDTVARLAGDEFVVLLEALRGGGRQEAERIARKIVDAVQQPFATAAGPVAAGASVGVAVSHGLVEPDQLLREADAALYRAKAAGRGTYCSA